MMGVFSDLHCENLVEVLWVILTKYGSLPWLCSPELCNSLSCPRLTSSESAITASVFQRGAGACGSFHSWLPFLVSHGFLFSALSPTLVTVVCLGSSCLPDPKKKLLTFLSVFSFLLIVLMNWWLLSSLLADLRTPQLILKDRFLTMFYMGTGRSESILVLMSLLTFSPPEHV